MTSNTTLHINLGAVEHNVGVFRDIVGPDCALCPILKADGYGLGVTHIARHLVAAGADMLAVYSLDQAALIARAAVGGPILVLMPVRDVPRIDESYRLLIQGRLHLTLHDPDHLEAMIRLADRFACPIPVHLEVDTGMGRGGCETRDVPAMIRRVEESRWLRLAGLCTHFANAARSPQATEKQMKIFEEILEACAADLPDECAIHVASTAAALRHRRYHRSMVRFGLGWAGMGAEGMTSGQFRRRGRELKPIVRWTSKLVQIKTIRKGATVGYGSIWAAKRRSTIGLVPVGYADGFPVGLGSSDERPVPPCVGVATSTGTQYVPVVGQVNMDQITVDLTDAARKGDIEIDAEVELIGDDPESPSHLATLARAAGTIPHEILCRLSPRVPREYRVTQMVEVRPAVMAGAGA